MTDCGDRFPQEFPMHHLTHSAIGLALIVGCADPQGLSNDEATAAPDVPALARAGVIRTNVGFGVSEPGNPLVVWVGVEGRPTLADICSGPQPLSLNTIAHIVIPPTGAFLVSSHGKDVPILVFETEGDICDGVGESLMAAGTGRFHFGVKFLRNGNQVANTGLRAVVDLVTGGRALVEVKSPLFVLPDGSVKFDKTRITLTPL
jgi:hypothetical protein